MPKKKQETTISVANGCMRRIYKLGTEGRPVTEQEVKDFKRLLELSSTDLPIVCPYEVIVQLVGLEEAHVYMNLADKGIISTKTLCEKLGLKYENLTGV